MTQTDPTTTEPRNGAISVPAKELRSRLKAVMPHAGTDDTLPVLTCVRFEVRDGWLYLVTTDRYTMAVARLRIPRRAQAAPLPDQDALLPMGAVKAMRRMLKDAAGTAAIIIGDGRFTVVVDGPAGATGSWETQSSAFPEWRSTLHKRLCREQVELGNRYGIDPRQLRRFAPASMRGGREPLHIRVTDAAVAGIPLVLVLRGDWFLGALMPVRVSGDEAGTAVTAAWDDWAAVTAPAAKAEAADQMAAAQ